MRKFITIVAVLATGIFIIAGQFYWEKKTSNHAPTVANAEKTGTVDRQKSDEKKSTENLDLLSAAINWPEQAQDTFEELILNGRPYKLALVGSESLGAENDGWSVMLEDALANVYGDSVEVGIFEYAEDSNQFISEGHDNEVGKFKPDFVLFEPFTLKDNQSLVSHSSHENIITFISTVRKENERAVFVLQPPHPIYNAKYYPAQVGQLKEFAEKEGLTYLDHWSQWPDGDDEKLRTYLQVDQGAPNEKGHEVWFDYLKKYFIAE